MSMPSWWVAIFCCLIASAYRVFIFCETFWSFVVTKFRILLTPHSTKRFDGQRIHCCVLLFDIILIYTSQICCYLNYDCLGKPRWDTLGQWRFFCHKTGLCYIIHRLWLALNCRPTCSRFVGLSKKEQSLLSSLTQFKYFCSWNNNLISLCGWYN